MDLFNELHRLDHLRASIDMTHGNFKVNGFNGLHSVKVIPAERLIAGRGVYPGDPDWDS